MKLATILRHGEAHPALVLTNESLRCQWCLDLADVNSLLPESGQAWGVEPVPASVRSIAQGGPAALDNLRRLQDRLLQALDAGDQERFGTALVQPEAVHWLPPIPDSPLFMTFHGNAIGLWRDRSVGMSQRAIISRVPACRLHPITSTLGHLEPLIFARDEPLGYGNELGVVLAPGGRHIAYEDASQHVWGVTNCDDVTRTETWRRKHYSAPHAGTPAFENESRARLGRASDASCPAGPWITTTDEVPDVLDLLMYAWGPDGGYSRAHTWSYIMGPHNAVAYLSRFMTIPAGAILQLGAAGVDGVGSITDSEQVHGQAVEVSMERVGTLANPVWCEEAGALQRQPGEGAYGLITRHRGLDVAQAFCPDEPIFPQHTRSIWVARFNDWHTAARLALGPDDGRGYEIMPPTALSTGEPIELHRYADRIDVSCELAAIIGSRPVARVAAADVWECLAGLTIMIGMRDHMSVAEVDLPTPREVMLGPLLGRWVDGFNAIKPALVPLTSSGDLANREMRVRLAGLGEVVTSTADYVRGLDDVISFLSREVSLLPGDVVSLGSAGRWLIIPADHKLPSDATVQASIEGLGDFAVPLLDHRGLRPPLHELV